jgi:hypothetical protein
MPPGQTESLTRKQMMIERIKSHARDAVRAEKLQRARTRATLVFDGEEDLSPTEYLVGGVIPAEGAGMLFAETDLGKTTTVLSLAVHVAAGKSWLGRTVERGTVLFIESEGGRAFALRKHAAKGAAGLGDRRQLPFAELPFVTVYEPLGFGPDYEAAAALANAERIRADVERRGLPPIRLVVVDTLAQNIAGDADSNEDMTAFLKLFRVFIKAMSGEPVFGLLNHHPGHQAKDRARGAYALEADLDLVMTLAGERNTTERTLECKRMRNGERFGQIRLGMESRVVNVDGEPVRDSRGRNQTALVVVEPGAAKETEQPARMRDQVLLAVLQALPEYPNKVPIHSGLVPAVTSLLGRSKLIDHKIVNAHCLTLEREGLAEKGPGTRGKNTFTWGKPAPESQPEPDGDM